MISLYNLFVDLCVKAEKLENGIYFKNVIKIQSIEYKSTRARAAPDMQYYMKTMKYK